MKSNADLFTVAELDNLFLPKAAMSLAYPAKFNSPEFCIFKKILFNWSASTAPFSGSRTLSSLRGLNTL